MLAHLPFLNQIALLRDAFPTLASLSKAVPHRGSLFSLHFPVFILSTQMCRILFSNPFFSLTLVEIP